MGIQSENFSPIMWTTSKLATISNSKSLSFVLEPLLNSGVLQNLSVLPSKWNKNDSNLKKLTINPKVLWCQLKAVSWIIFLLLSFIPCLLVCTFLWLIQDKEDVR